MGQHLSTTPFGRRPLSLAMVAAQAAAKACPKDATAHKWRVFRNLTEAKDRLGLSDRALAVLSALLTFHQDTALTPGDEIIVFPSNRELCVRAHGPALTTLRRALAQLVAAGLVIRRDSPNGKRYARKGEGGLIEQAFGFDLTPLVARAAEFEYLAGEVRAEARARHLLREEISLHRRDIAKTIATAIEENLPGLWSDLADRFRQLGGMPPRSAAVELLEALACDLRALWLDVDKCLAESAKTEDLHPNESQSGTHHQNSNSDTNLEWLLSGSGVVTGTSGDKARDEGAEESFAPAARVVYELEEAEVVRQLLLRDAPMRAEPRAQQRPETLDRVDVHLAEPVPVLVAGVFAAPVTDRLVLVAPGWQAGVDTILVGVDEGALSNGGRDDRLDRDLLHVGQHAQHHLATTLDQAENGWLVLLQRAPARRAGQPATASEPPLLTTAPGWPLCPATT